MLKKNTGGGWVGGGENQLYSNSTLVLSLEFGVELELDNYINDKRSLHFICS